MYRYSVFRYSFQDAGIANYRSIAWNGQRRGRHSHYDVARQGAGCQGIFPLWSASFHLDTFAGS